MVYAVCKQCEGSNLTIRSGEMFCHKCGHIEDWELHEMIDYDINLESDYWVALDGRKVEIADMSSTELFNAINQLKSEFKKNELVGSHLFQLMASEYMLRGV